MKVSQMLGPEAKIQLLSITGEAGESLLTESLHI